MVKAKYARWLFYAQQTKNDNNVFAARQSCVKVRFACGLPGAAAHIQNAAANRYIDAFVKNFNHDNLTMSLLKGDVALGEVELNEKVSEAT